MLLVEKFYTDEYVSNGTFFLRFSQISSVLTS